MFAYRQQVLFRHCDPAGIVFYPRYFEMLNDVVEALFASIDGQSFEAMHPQRGVPTARIETEFSAPSRHGDWLDFSLGFSRVGTTSAETMFRCTCEGELRLTARSVLVHVDALRPAPWPDVTRQVLLGHLLTSTD